MSKLMNLFDVAEDNGIDINNRTLSVVNAQMKRVEKISWQELFDGFDELYAITFSSGIDFTVNLLSRYKYAEIIYGCEAILPNSIAAAMSVQTELVKKIAKNKSASILSKKIDDGTLALYVSRDTRSHEKVFCLRSNDGRVRVVTGSANMSATAFAGIQRENILCFDDQDAYDYYFNLFEAFKMECADNVNYKIIAKAIENPEEYGEDIEEIPIIKTVQEQKVVYLENAKSEEDDEIEIIASIKGHEDELRGVLPKLSKDGNKTVLTIDDLLVVKKKAREATEKKKVIKRKTPKLHIDYENGELLFNGLNIDLNPDRENVKKDVDCILNYINSINKFNGKKEDAQKNYYRFMNWYFCSPFMAYLRYIAFVNNYDVLRFPVVGIIYGNSNGGKSTFIKLLTKLMCGKSIPANNTNDFTSTTIDKLKRLCEGIPIYIDDLAKQQYTNNNEKIIKDDNWGISEKLIHYPAIAITTNKLPSVTADISKRAVTCHIDAKISNEEGAKASKKINDAIKKADTALYAEYVSEMLKRILKMEELMKKEDSDYFPDILAESSDVLKKIIENKVDTLPVYVEKLNYFSYFGASAIGKNAINKIRLAWENEPNSFRSNKKQNTLTYTFNENAYYDMKYIVDELPPTLNAQITGNGLVMNLKEAQAFFNYSFKKHFWENIIDF